MLGMDFIQLCFMVIRKPFDLSLELGTSFLQLCFERMRIRHGVDIKHV